MNIYRSEIGCQLNERMNAISLDGGRTFMEIMTPQEKKEAREDMISYYKEYAAPCSRFPESEAIAEIDALLEGILTVSEKLSGKTEKRTGFKASELRLGDEEDLQQGQILARGEKGEFLVSFGYPIEKNDDGPDIYSDFRIIIL